MGPYIEDIETETLSYDLNLSTTAANGAPSNIASSSKSNKSVPSSSSERSSSKTNKSVSTTTSNNDAVGCTLSDLICENNNLDNSLEDSEGADLIDFNSDERFVNHNYSVDGADDEYPGENSCSWVHCAAHHTQTILREIERKHEVIKSVKERNDHIGRFCRREQVAAYIKEQANVMFQKAGKTRWSSNISAACRLWNVSFL